ncbi:MAG TPA: GNAT family N-acetyltransferase [Terriglobia bacterium]|nr:GNAT family N-acetyltransferase [Terriglobia bacterium]
MTRPFRFTEYSIRPCETLEEFEACVKLQKQVFGYAEGEAYPQRLFVNLTHIGGHILGAFASTGELVGFVASMPAWHRDRRYYHSLSLGVLPGHENRGLGRALKLAQRRAALDARIDCIQWTFDPLRPKNAFLNIERLGAIARRYLPNYYGRVESRLQQGLPSDRLLAEWQLRSTRMKRALAGNSPRSSRRKPAAAVAIPNDFAALADNDPAAALAQQSLVREQLQECFARGLAITGVSRDGETYCYLLDESSG